MNKHPFKQPLIAIGLLALVGAVGAETYYTHELAKRVALTDAESAQETISGAANGSWDPWTAMHADMMRMRSQMDQAFDSVFNTTFNDTFKSFNGPSDMDAQTGVGKLTLNEQGDNYVVEANIPGAKEGDINVNLNGRLLSISSQTQASKKQTGDNNQVIRQENYASAFQQAFTLPGPVKASGMHTQFKDGVLTVTIPKAAS